MNVLYLHRTRGKGVEGVHIQGIADGFRRFGFDVDIVSPYGTENFDSTTNIRKIGRKERIFQWISRHSPELLFETMEILFNFQMYRNLIGISSRNYNFIYERYAIFNFIGAYFASKKHIPLVLEMNYLASSPLVRRRGLLHRLLATRFERYVTQKAERIVVVSSTLRDELIRSGIPEAKILLLPNAANPDVFDPAKFDKEVAKKALGIPSDSTVIGFVGGFYPWHGVPWMMQSLASVMRDSNNMHVLLVGDGPERGKTETVIREHAIENRVRFLGSVPHKDLHESMAAMDFGVMPHSNNYGSPMKVFEYMSMGIPVVAPDLPPLRDVVVDGHNGFLFPPGNDVGFINIISKVLSHHYMQVEMGINCRNSVLDKYNWDTHAKRIIECLNKDNSL
jgi:glycosyltransferase involved in cell wall biosynthesis